MLTSLFPEPFPPRSGTRFSGWRIVAVAAIALGMTGPGQTVGVSVFIDPMIEALGLTRSQVSGAYLIGTLSGAFALPHVGRFLDARGTRITMALVGLVSLVLGFAGIGVGSTAFGPLALSLGRDLTGSYQQVLLVLFPVAVIVLGLSAPVPSRAPRPTE